MKVSEVIDRIKRINVIVDRLDNVNKIDEASIEDIIDLLDEYRDELLNKVIK